MHHDGFGYFKLQKLGRKSGFRKNPFHGLDKILFRKLPGGEVHGQTKGRAFFILPGKDILACLFQHPFADRDYKTGFLGYRKKHIRRQNPLLRMLPAQQRLNPDYPAVDKIQYRLIVEKKFLFVYRPSKVPLQKEPLKDDVVHLLFKELPIILTTVLGMIHRSVSAFHQSFRVIAVLRKHGDTDADSGIHLMFFQDKRFDHCRLHSLRHPGRISYLIDFIQQHGKFIPSLTGKGVLFPFRRRAADRIAFPEARINPDGNAFEQKVSYPVPESVVDGLEIVNVNKENRQDPLVPPGMRKGYLQPV